MNLPGALIVLLLAEVFFVHATMSLLRPFKSLLGWHEPANHAKSSSVIEKVEAVPDHQTVGRFTPVDALNLAQPKLVGAGKVAQGRPALLGVFNTSSEPHKPLESAVTPPEKPSESADTAPRRFGAETPSASTPTAATPATMTTEIAVTAASREAASSSRSTTEKSARESDRLQTRQHPTRSFVVEDVNDLFQSDD